MKIIGEKKQALANKAKKVEKFKDVVRWNLVTALGKQVDWLGYTEDEQASKKGDFLKALNLQLRAQNSKGMSYKRNGRSGIIDNKSNTGSTSSII